MSVEIEESVETIRRAPPKTRLTWEEFLAWLDEDTHAEWVGGEIVMASPASMRHQQVAKLLTKVLDTYVEHHNLGEVFQAPFVMRLEARERGREPDLLFVSRERLNLIRATFLDGAADLVVEIISPESIGRDRGEKFVEYEASGVREYWLIDPDRQMAEFYELGDDSRYHLARLDEDNIYRSRVVSGFWLRTDWLWQTPPPATLVLLHELDVL
jgi:Uma2 family endonuclease